MFSITLKRAVTSAVVKNLLNNSVARMSSVPTFETLLVTVPKPFVYHVELNRPKKMNAISLQMWEDIGKCFNDLNSNADCRVVILSGVGKAFTSGIDLNSMAQLGPELAEIDDLARKAKIFRSKISKYQEALSSMEKCSKPVLSAIHSACIGAGIDAITGTDIRYCTKDAFFEIKETVIGMAADVGTLQRLPKIIGSQSLVRELCFTGRRFFADEALSSGLVSKVFDDKESMIADVLKTAENIASKSPVAVQATKASLIYSRDHSVQDGLDHIASLNQFLLQSEDFTNAVMAQMTKEDVVFSKL